MTRIFKLFLLTAILSFLPGVAAAQSAAPWQVNPSQYRYDMSLYLDFTFGPNEMDYEAYEVAAFAGEECRGIGKVLRLEGTERPVIYLRAYSNTESGENLTLRYYSKANAKTEPIEGVSFPFVSGSRVGMPSEPKNVNIVRFFTVDLSMEGEGSLTVEPGRYAEGTELTVKANPAEGYHFAGWSDGTTAPEVTFTVNSDVSLKATFEVNVYKLIYKVDGVETESFDVPYKEPVTAIAEPTKTGYTFSGWNGVPATMPAKDVEVTGTFTINQYHLVFKAGETVVFEGDVDYNSAITAPAVPAKEGHTFAGWDTFPANMPAEDLTVTGTYTVNKYKLTYTVDGAKYDESEVDYGTPLTAIAAPVKEGYTFSGWSELPATMPAKDVTISGTFSINTYKATFKIGEENVATLDVVFGQPVTAPEAPAKEGHTFAGWQDVPETMPAHDVTILGSYTVNKYKLNYVIDGEEYKTIEVEYGTAIVPETPEKEGYTFSGWEGLPETMPAEDVTTTGKFNINTYKASFKIGEETIATLDVVFGQPVTAPEAPAKEGHTFAGWQDVPATMPAHDVTVLGSYTVNKYNLSYIIDGENYKTVEVEYGAAIVPETPEKEGYTFSGWEGLPETMPAEDVTATGKFNINTYKASFKIGEETIATLDVVFGQPVTAPEAPAKEGHTFAGWQDVPETMPAHDVTVLGSYTVNKYNLSYIIDGENYKTVEVEYGAAIVPEAPEKEGYTFSGWEGLPETMPAEDVTATGSFTVNNYKLTVYLNDEIYLEQTLEYGAEIVIPDPELPEHLVFKGWEEEIPETMPAHDVTIHGRYDDTSGVSQIRIDDDCNVTVVTPEGQLLYRDRSWSEVKQKLRHGIYIINGARHLIR